MCDLPRRLRGFACLCPELASWNLASGDDGRHYGGSTSLPPLPLFWVDQRAVSAPRWPATRPTSPFAVHPFRYCNRPGSTNCHRVDAWGRGGRSWTNSRTGLPSPATRFSSSWFASEPPLVHTALRRIRHVRQLVVPHRRTESAPPYALTTPVLWANAPPCCPPLVERPAPTTTGAPGAPCSLAAAPPPP